MIVAKEVKNTMQQQKIEFTDKRHSNVCGIPGRRGRRDDDIAQKKSTPANHFPFLLGKGDDIGRFIALQIVAIDLTDAPVANDEDRDFSVRTSRDA